MSNLSYGDLVTIIRAFERLYPTPPRFRIRPSEYVSEDTCYRLQIPAEFAEFDKCDVLYVLHPDTLFDLRQRGFTDEELSVALEELSKRTSEGSSARLRG